MEPGIIGLADMKGGKRGREKWGEGGPRSYEQTNVIARESALTLQRARLIR